MTQEAAQPGGPLALLLAAKCTFSVTSSQYDFLVEKETLSALGRFPHPTQTQACGPVGLLTSDDHLLGITHRMGTGLQWSRWMCAQRNEGTGKILPEAVVTLCYGITGLLGFPLFFLFLDTGGGCHLGKS